MESEKEMERKRGQKEKASARGKKSAMCVVGCVIYHLEKWQMQIERWVNTIVNLFDKHQGAINI